LSYDFAVDSQPALVEGRDYYIDDDGLYVFTEAYLLARGTCCRSGCRHCPYGFVRESDPTDDQANGVVDDGVG
jgi:hypothetical protein